MRGFLDKYPIGKNPEGLFVSSEGRYFLLYWDEQTGLTLKYFRVYGADDKAGLQREEDELEYELKGILTNITKVSQDPDENKKYRFTITGQKDGKKCELICDAFDWKRLKGRNRRYADNYRAKKWVDRIKSQLKQGPPEPAKASGGGYRYFLFLPAWKKIPKDHKVKFDWLHKYPIGKNPGLFTNSEERYFILYWDPETELTLKYFRIHEDEEGVREELKGTLTNITEAFHPDENKKYRFTITGIHNGKKCELICDAFTINDWKKKREKSDDKAENWVTTIKSELKQGPPEKRTQASEGS